ncbi:MAG: hypothetical protein R6X02_09710 [Enhygromyxa sp.]
MLRACLLAGAVALSGCASKTGWSVTEARTCAPRDPARVCSLTAPDYGHVLELGDVEMIPGECAVLDGAGRGGLIRVETRDPRGEGRRRWVRAPRSQATILVLERDGDVDALERRSCDRTPISLE